MNLKKFFKALLYPHFSVLLILTPVAAALLVYTFTSQKQDSFFAYISYVLSAYTLTVVCLRIPAIILTLESTMLTTFGEGSMTLADRRILLGVSGAVISVFIIGMSVHMIAYSSKKIKGLSA